MSETLPCGDSTGASSRLVVLGSGARAGARLAELERQGWTRRFVADQARAAEACELYGSMNLEVRIETLRPEDFGPSCAGCGESFCDHLVLIYTRELSP